MTEVTATSFDEEGVMMRSSKMTGHGVNRVWLETLQIASRKLSGGARPTRYRSCRVRCHVS